MMRLPLYNDFLQQHRLDAAYLQQTGLAMQAVIDDILQRLDQKTPVILGINGSQGSGKTTLAAFLQTALQAEHGLHVVCLSMDDFYLGKAARQQLAQQVHPLLATRGVPGTHDTGLAIRTLQALRQHQLPVALPRFDKASDDSEPQAHWPLVQQPVDVVILEGWCLGASAQLQQQLHTAVNALEAEEDADGRWRDYVNTQLATAYPAWFDVVDCWVMLKAPSFDCVYRWRLEQEQKLAAKLQNIPEAARQGLMNEVQVHRFIQYFQRLTDHILNTLPAAVDHLYLLNSERQIIDDAHNTGTQTADIYRS